MHPQRLFLKGRRADKILTGAEQHEESRDGQQHAAGDEGHLVAAMIHHQSPQHEPRQIAAADRRRDRPHREAHLLRRGVARDQRLRGGNGSGKAADQEAEDDQPDDIGGQNGQRHEDRRAEVGAKHHAPPPVDVGDKPPEGSEEEQSQMARSRENADPEAPLRLDGDAEDIPDVEGDERQRKAEARYRKELRNRDEEQVALPIEGLGFAALHRLPSITDLPRGSGKAA